MVAILNRVRYPSLVSLILQPSEPRFEMDADLRRDRVNPDRPGPGARRENHQLTGDQIR
jgi:hypothetical protein